MNFLEVLEGLKEGKTYAISSFSSDEYLVLDECESVCMYTHGEIEQMSLNIKEMLSDEWFERPKKIMYIVGVDVRSHIVSDEMYSEYVISEEDKEWADSWEDKVLSEWELKAYKAVVDLRRSKRNDWREEQEKRLKEIFQD